MGIRKGARASAEAAVADRDELDLEDDGRDETRDETGPAEATPDETTEGKLGDFVVYTSTKQAHPKLALVVGTPASIAGGTRIPPLQATERHLLIFDVSHDLSGFLEGGQRDLVIFHPGGGGTYAKQRVQMGEPGTEGTWHPGVI
jgi:hypothetical protein